MRKASRNRWKWVSDLIEPTTKMWNEALIRKIFYPPDAEHILQIKLPFFSGEDYLAWHYEKSGLFTVKSAYRLAMDRKGRNNVAGVSNKNAGERELWNMIWKADVPPKVRVFGWKLATNTLGVQDLRCKRNMDRIPTCQICGMEPETNYHAMVNCTKAKALCQCLRKDWDLPDEQSFRYTGQDWVLVLLSQVTQHMQAKLLFLWWRSCTYEIMLSSMMVSAELNNPLFLQSLVASNQDKTDIEMLSDPKVQRPILWHQIHGESHNWAG
jgi:hypothetical protein